jgi:DNA primase
MNRHLAPIEAARRRHSLAEVATRTGILLPATGGAVTVRCPMPSHGHPDRTPSLRLYLDDGTWYCFACSDRARDAVQWAEQTERVGWREAIGILDSGRPLTNAWAGVPSDTGCHRRAAAAVAVEMADPGRTPRPRVQEVLDATWAHATIGPLHARAVAYLAGRHIDVTVLESYTRRQEVGHTPTYGPSLAQRLISDGFHPTEIVDAGIACRRPGGELIDFYSHRVLIPIRDDNGRLAGLVGRNVGNPHSPKYKNPPRTVLYDKSANLYQPLPTPRHPDGRIIVVEGTLDAMAIAVAAIRTGTTHRFCPVTQSGRVVSQLQLERVLERHDGVVVAGFDGDAAGRQSNLRLAAAVQARGRKVVMVCLPEGEDPASILAHLGPRALGLWDRPALDYLGQHMGEDPTNGPLAHLSPSI